METNRIFTNWKQRCSGLGHIMTNLPQPITEEEKKEMEDLKDECRTGVNSNGNKTKWTETKANRVKSLEKKEKGEDLLPSGAKTHLDNVFRSQFWRRKDLLENKYLEHGNFTEQDVLDLFSKTDGSFYIKNDEYLWNDFIEGTADNIDESGSLVIVRDAKSKFSLKTLEESELTQLYSWQLKGYSWLVKEKLGLDYFPKGELCCGLVNGLESHIQNETTSLYYKMGCPSDDNEKWMEMKMQIERNHIFDIKKFKEDYPNYVFVNPVLDFDIPPSCRVMKFEVETTEEDVASIKSRVMLSRIYLVQKEIETLKKMKQI
jgi:hypothetical protein